MSAEDQSTATDCRDDDELEDQQLYSGRWTNDEEKYAQCLIEEFRAGNIEDLENGATLRNYIAKMLICPPKRITKKYERTAYNGKLTYCRNLVAIPEEQAKQRREQLQELREKFLLSRKHRLSGKPYQRPSKRANTSQQKQSASTAPASAAPAAVSTDASSGVAGLGRNLEIPSQDPTAILRALNPGLVMGLTQGLSQPQLPSNSTLPFAALASNVLLGHTTNPLVAAGLRQQLLLNRNLTLRNSFLNPSILDNRNPLLNPSLRLGVGLPASREVARQTLLAQMRGEEERMFLRVAGLSAASGLAVQQPTGNQEEKTGLANQIIATITQAPANVQQPRVETPVPSPPRKRSREAS